jgi:hypothetical protein
MEGTITAAMAPSTAMTTMISTSEKALAEGLEVLGALIITKIVDFVYYIIIILFWQVF